MEHNKTKGFRKTMLAVAVLSFSITTAYAGEKEELLKLRNTTTNLINLLVKQGILSQENAQQMIKQAEQDAVKQVKLAAKADIVPADVVRVPYVPEFVRDQIRQQVRADLRADVVADVMKEAETQQWGIPNALPEWTRKFKLYGDMRLRYEHDHFAESNFVNPLVSAANSVNNFQALNNEGKGFNTVAGLENINKDRDRFRARFRLGLKAKVTQGLEANLRLATGNIKDPVSTNQTLGNTGQKFDFNIDRAFLKYEGLDSDVYNWMTLQGGRIPNPFRSTNLIFDKDLSFEGFASTFRYNMAGSDSLYDQEDQTASMFLTLGAFPLQEFQLSTKDKWMLGGQVGTDWEFLNQDKAAISVGYYNYINTKARPRTGTNLQLSCSSINQDSDASIPEYLQKGNSMTPVCYDNAGINPQKFGLAPEFEILNITASYDMAMFAPIHVKLTGDYAKNLGFNKNEIQQRIGTGVIYNNPKLENRTVAWQARLDFGWPTTLLPGKWNSYVAYKYIESDAVLDAFTDSDFHLGGTNAKGWVIGGNYGVVDNAWLSAKWMSTDQIDGPKVGIDILLIDFNAKF